MEAAINLMRKGLLSLGFLNCVLKEICICPLYLNTTSFSFSKFPFRSLPILFICVFIWFQYLNKGLMAVPSTNDEGTPHIIISFNTAFFIICAIIFSVVRKF